MPQFFIPGTANPEEAENVLASIAPFVHRPIPPPHERIFRLVYEHNGKRYVAQVGQPIDPYYRSEGPVIAIFGGNPLLICMRDRGVLRGEPIYVGNQAWKEQPISMSRRCNSARASRQQQRSSP